MFGYIGHLRGMTSGRASYTMEFSHYEPVPRNVADEVIAAANKSKAAALRLSWDGRLLGLVRVQLDHLVEEAAAVHQRTDADALVEPVRA